MFLQDMRHSVRAFRARPGLTAAAVLTLALGIGANTTVFSIVDSLLLRPMPGIARPPEIVLIGRTQEGAGFVTCSYPDFRDYRAQATRSSSASQPICFCNSACSRRARRSR